MTQYNAFWDGTTLGNAGPYSSEDFARFLRSIMNASEEDNQGVFIAPNNGTQSSLQVTETSPASKSVLVREGAALVEGRWYYTDSDVNVTIPDNTDGSGFDRIDLLVLRKNETTQTITPTLITGTPAGAPVAPSPVRVDPIFDIEIAQIEADNLFTTIVNADIDNTVKNTVPIWQTKNGGTGLEGGSVKGDLLIGTAADTYGLLNYSGNDGDRLAIDTAQATGFKYIDPTPSVVWLASLGATTSYSNPMVLNSSDDNAGNFRSALSANTFFPEAGFYEVYGEFQVHSSSSQLFYCYLHNTNTGTLVNDVAGQPIRSTQGTVNAGTQVVQVILPRYVEFAGNENLQLRFSASGLVTNNTVTIPPYQFYLRRVG